MMVPRIVVRPVDRYRPPNGRLNRGGRRHEGILGRTLALFDTLGIRKRAIRTHITLSADGYAALCRRAAAEGVSVCGLGAYIIEAVMREAS